MYKSIMLLISACILSGGYVSSQTIWIPSGSPVTLDGNISSGEWDDALPLYLQVVQPTTLEDLTITVKVKHDGNALLVAYINNLEYTERFVEIWIDADNGKTIQWAPDDWWFHASLHDCESQGTANNYTLCDTVLPGWEASENIEPGYPLTDTMEVRIPFAKISNSLGINDTIGLALCVATTMSLAPTCWPHAEQPQIPATWGNAILSASFLQIPENPHESANASLVLFPNPCNDQLFITGKFQEEEKTVRILSMDGNIIQTTHPLAPTGTIQVENLPPGMYILQVMESGEVYRFVKQ